ncbi:pantoate--beta-alanine ligase [Demequina muriae]|uniref:Pantothenate synthetase n=1 Tax=Demequina muriae TaxID=3051664 RepID=A0ABT8GFD9_9MICO|nr:pantoate--beta-alanine ligase [Demequina sp. EGI L300058]MDN4480152.1 pantoate--beta-alanine ligase [Demequina sp. EGI L300058]
MILAPTAAELPERPSEGTRAVVMTMGALHEGHLTLVRRARQIADQVVVTIFVNPLQFNDPGDLDRYPRTLEADCALLAAEGVDAVFAPSVDEMYPGGDPVVTVSAGVIGDVFEGEHRPGHFDGVLTVVLKLLHLTSPDVALFGAKDAQQVIAVRTMVRDLAVPVRIEAVPTVRDPDGLALSSRNAHLSSDDRDSALALSRALAAAEAAARNGASAADVVRSGMDVLAGAARASAGITVDYVAALDPRTAHEVPADHRGEAVIAVAATVRGTRLIDNTSVLIEPEGSPS